MVNNDLFDNKFFLKYSDAKEVVESFMKKQLSNYVLDDAQNHGMAFILVFSDHENTITFLSDRGDLSFKLIMNGTEIDLLKFEPLLSHIEWFSRKNILFVLSTIKSFVEEQSFT